VSARSLRAGESRRRDRGTLLLIGTALVCVSLTAHSQDAGAARGAVHGRSPVVSTYNKFTVLQIATTDPDQLVAEWQKPTPSVSLTTTTQAAIDQPIVTFIIFRGCRADASGNCDVTVDFETFGPDGRRYDNTRAVDVWVGHPPAGDTDFQLSETGYDVCFEGGDPLGAYRIHATVTDHVAGIALETEQMLTVIPGQSSVRRGHEDSGLLGISERPL